MKAAAVVAAYFLGMEKKLTDKQEKFCQEYIIDLNATQAAIRSGYSEKTARSQGQRLLTNVDIQERIAELQKEWKESIELRKEDVINEVRSLAFARVTDVANIVIKDVVVGHDESGNPIEREMETVEFKETENLPDNVKASIASIGMGRNGIVLKMHDKSANLDKLMRYLGMYDEDESNKQPNVINVNINSGGVPPVTSEDDIDENI